MTTMSPVRQTFDTSDSIFDFDPVLPPTPPKSTDDTLGSKPKEADAGEEAEFDADDFFNFEPLPPKKTPSAPQRDGLRLDSPPPDMDEEPEGWEDEMMAMRDMEEEEGLARTRKALDAPAPSGDAVRGEQRRMEGKKKHDGFGDSDMFDFDIPEASCKSFLSELSPDIERVRIGQDVTDVL